MQGPFYMAFMRTSSKGISLGSLITIPNCNVSWILWHSFALWDGAFNFLSTDT